MKALREIYKGLITVSISNRIATLASALQWYDSAIRYLLSKKKAKLFNDDWTHSFLSEMARARLRATRAREDNEKEFALKATLQLCEQICATLRPPSLSSYYALLEEKESALLSKKERLEQRHGRIVKLLEKATGNRIKIEIADARKPAQFNPALTTLNYNRAAVRELAAIMKRDGFLAVFVSQLPRLVRQAVLDRDWKGGWRTDESQVAQAYQDLLSEFVTFCQGAEAPRQLVKMKGGRDRREVIGGAHSGTRDVEMGKRKGEKESV